MTAEDSGLPRLELALSAPNAGSTTTSLSGIGQGSLTFSYTVPAGIARNDLSDTGTGAMTLNGLRLLGTEGTAADLTLPAPGSAGSLSANASIVIDPIAPVAQFTDGPDRFQPGTGFTVILTSTETITAFDPTRITVTGGTLTRSAARDAQCRTLTPQDGAQEITPSMTAATFTDPLGNPVIPAEDPTIPGDTTAPVVAKVPEDIEVETEAGSGQRRRQLDAADRHRQPRRRDHHLHGQPPARQPLPPGGDHRHLYRHR